MLDEIMKEIEDLKLYRCGVCDILLSGCCVHVKRSIYASHYHDKKYIIYKGRLVEIEGNDPWRYRTVEKIKAKD